MNADRLLKHYEKISDASDAITRLRRFILDLAVRGKLVPQNSSEEAAKRFRKPTDPAAPFELPNNWKWIEIGDQLNLLNGMAFKPTDWIKEGLRIVRIQNLNNPKAPFNFCNPEVVRERSLIDNGSFLISWSGTPGTSFGAFIWDRGPAVLNQQIFRCDFRTKAFSAKFLRLAINGRLDEMIAKAHGGVGLQHITKGKLEALLISLPPLAEQHRIVAKVDELMALCDRLAAASLARLNAPDPQTFQADARFALDALPALTSRPNQIKAMRQFILNLAVRGVFTARSKTTMAASCSEMVSNDPKPYPIGQDWRWVRMDEIVHFAGGSQPPKSTFIYEPRAGYTRLVQIRDFKSDAHLTFVPTENANRPFKEDDVMIGRYGPPVFQILRGLSGTYNVALMKAAPIVQDLANDFLFFLLQESRIHDEVVKESERTAGQTGVRLPLLYSFVVGLPPLAEQHRIVAKVDELMALCDQLEASLTATAATRRRLLDALLAEALAPADARERDAAE